MCFAVYSIMSTRRGSPGRGPPPFLLRDVFLRTSFWMVRPAFLATRPASRPPRCSAEREDRAGVDGHAGGDAVERDPAEEDLEVLQRRDGDPFLPTSRATWDGRRRSPSGQACRRPCSGRHPVFQQVLEALVRVLRRSESGELAHRPQPPRYMLGCGPRVYGNCPGNPRSRWYLSTSASLGSPASAGVSKSGMGMPESVWNPAWRMGSSARPGQVRPAPLFLGCPEAVLGLHDREITRVWQRRDPAGRWAYARRLHRNLAAAHACP